MGAKFSTMMKPHRYARERSVNARWMPKDGEFRQMLAELESWTDLRAP